MIKTYIFGIMSINKKGGESMRIVNRGEIYYADLGDLSDKVGSEQAGMRPVVVIQNDKGNMCSPTTVVVPLTSNLNKNTLPIHCIVSTGREDNKSLAVCEQIRVIDKSRLKNKIGKLPISDMQDLEKSLLIELGFMTF